MTAAVRTISWRVVLAAGVTALLLSACATLPDTGPVTSGQVSGADGQGQPYLVPIPQGPTPGEGPDQIVNGFLAASASFANLHAVAKEYLTPQAAKIWNPGWQVHVVTGLAAGTPHDFAHQAGTYGQTANVQVVATGEELASLTQNGQYVGTQEKSFPVTFLLSKVDGQWRITNPPQELVLSQSDFQRVYVPQDLYFLASSGQAAATTLIPDPVFVPLDTTPVSLVSQLVHALLSDPQGWLAGAARTALPGAQLLRPVTFDGGTAIVDLGGRGVATASSAQLSEMTAQLNWTLANPADGQAPVQSVQLEINGQLRQSADWSGDQPSQSRPTVPAAPDDAVLYSAGPNGAVQELAGSPPSWRDVPGQAGQGTVPLTTIAVSPDGRFVSGLTKPGFTKSGGGVYYGALQRDARLTHWAQAEEFSSMSWDVHDNLWVAGPRGVWKIPPGGQPVRVTVGLPQGYQVSQLRVAPDGVRVAMIVQSPGGGGAQLRVGAITQSSKKVFINRTGQTESIGNQGVFIGRTGQLESIGNGVSDPIQLTWYDADNLIVLSKPSGGPQLQEVPINGGTPQQLAVASNSISISAAGPGNALAAGLSRGGVATTLNLNGSWTPVSSTGFSPTYPG